MRLKSQIDAPIELVVAVIILSLSLGIAFYVINSTTNSKCEAELRDSTRELGNAMIDISLNSPPAKREVQFTFKNCPNYHISGLRFIRYTEPDYCRSCKGRYGGCWKIEPVYLQTEGDVKRQYVLHEAEQCMDLSSDVDIKQKQGDTVNQCTELNTNENGLVVKADDPTDRSKIVLDDSIQVNGNPAYSNSKTLGSELSEGSSWKIILEKESIITGTSITGQINICAVKLA